MSSLLSFLNKSWIVLLVVIAIIGLFVWSNQDQKTTAITNATTTILNAIKDSGVLVTTEYHMAKSNLEVRVEEGFLNIGGFQRRYVVEGTISAGINLELVTPEDVIFDPELNRYSIVLPSASLAYCDVSSEIYNQNVNFFLTGVSIEEQAIAERIADHTALITFRDEAIEDGILDRSEDQARGILSSVFHAVLIQSGTDNIPTINIEFEPIDANDLPRSCQPQDPPGWEYIEETKHWRRID